MTDAVLRKIVVADDTEMVRAIVLRALEHFGYTCFAASDGVEALSLVRREKPDLLLCDLRMPNLDGLGLLKQVRQDFPDLPVIVMSGEGLLEDAIGALQLGAWDYVCKPVAAATLGHAISKALEKAALIEENRRQRAELEAINRELSTVFRSSPVAMAITSVASTRYVDANEMFVRSSGFDREEIIGHTSEELRLFVDPADRQRLLSEVHARGFAYCLRMRFRMKAGNVRDGLISGHLIRLDGQPHLLSTIADVTEHQRIEDEVRSARAFLDSSINAIGDPIFVRDEMRRFVLVNDAFCTAVGRPRERLLGQVGDDLCPPEQAECIRQVDNGVLESGIEAITERSSKKPSSPDVRTIVTRKSRYVDLTGKRFLVVVVRDITERKQVEAALLESEEKYRSIFDASRDAILTMEVASGRFVDANPATLAMFRAQSLADFTSRGPMDLAPVHQSDNRLSRQVGDEKRQIALQEGSVAFEWTHRRLDGHEFPASVLLCRMERGGKLFLQATIRDLSDQKKLENELALAHKLESVGQLASGIAHEINTPAQYVGDSVSFLKEAFEGYRRLVAQYQKAAEVLAAAGHEELVGAIRATEEDIDLPYLEANAPKSFETCLDGISRISTIVRAMKEFAHPGHKEKLPANLNQVLLTTLAIAKNEYKYVAEVVTDFGDLPAVPCYVADLNQVFLNLLVNAAHAIADVVGQSGEKGTIRIKTSREGNLACIDIADTGAGIPPAIRHRIFDPFFTTKEVGRGTGQGLAIARSVVVNKHGGALTFDTEMGKGTTFKIRLPIADS